MKLSISLPDALAREVKSLATQNDRTLSWYFQQAWLIARESLFTTDKDLDKQHKKAMKRLKKLRGSLKKTEQNSITLAKNAFKNVD